MEKKFTWLKDSCFPRKGPKLIKGELHNAADYDPKVLEEWAKTKCLMFESEPKPKKEK